MNWGLGFFIYRHRKGTGNIFSLGSWTKKGKVPDSIQGSGNLFGCC